VLPKDKVSIRKNTEAYYEDDSGYVIITV